MITALRHVVVCDHAQYSSTGQLTFIGVAGDAFVVDVIPTARQVWLGISMDLDGSESVVTLRVEAPGYDHSLTITVPPGPTNTSFMLPVTVPAGDREEFIVSLTNDGGPERQFAQRWRLDAEVGADRLPADEAALVVEAANEATSAVFAQIAAQQAASRH